MCGPESKKFASDRSHLDKVFVLMEYREGADPSYPEFTPDTYHDVFKAIGVTGKKLRIGVASYLDTSVVIMEGIKSAFPEAEIVNAGYIMTELRSIKSANEIACLREGYRIAELATLAGHQGDPPGHDRTANGGRGPARGLRKWR